MKVLRWCLREMLLHLYVLLAFTGELQIPQEALYKKNVLLVRGRFNPFTNLHNDMLMGAANQFFCHPSEGGLTVSDTFEECVFRDDTSVVLEITTKDMMEVSELPHM